jgi:hypothetical protein
MVPLGHHTDVFKEVAKIALDVPTTESSMSVYKDMGWLPLHLRRQMHLSCFALSKIIVQKILKSNLAIFQVDVGVPITATYISLNPEVIRNFLILGLCAGIAYLMNIEI